MILIFLHLNNFSIKVHSTTKIIIFIIFYKYSINFKKKLHISLLSACDVAQLRLRAQQGPLWYDKINPNTVCANNKKAP